MSKSRFVTATLLALAVGAGGAEAISQPWSGDGVRATQLRGDGQSHHFVPEIAPVDNSTGTGSSSRMDRWTTSNSRSGIGLRSDGETPIKAEDRYFFKGDDGALYVREGIAGKSQKLLEAGAFDVISPSNNGEYLAYTSGGTEKADVGQVLHVINVKSGKQSDRLGNVLIEPRSWTKNNKGFFYTRVDSADKGRHRVYYHQIGQTQSDDKLVLSRMDQPDWRYAVRVTDDGAYAVITISHSLDAHTRLYFVDLDNPGKPRIDAPVVKLMDQFSARYEFIDNGGPYFFMRTDQQAPAGQVVVANTVVLNSTSWQSVIPESADTLEFVRTAGNEYIIAVSKNSGKTVARVYAPPSAREVQNEMRRRADSARRAEGTRARTRDRGGRGEPGVPQADFESRPILKLNLLRELPVEEGGVIIDMTSVAHDDELVYTVRFIDGTTRSYVHNVKTRKTAFFDKRVGAN